MPTIEVSLKDLNSLIGKKLSSEKLKDFILYAKGEVEDVSGDVIKIDMKDTNRPDLWSAEGIAREIKGRLNKGGLPEYIVEKSENFIKVDKKVSNVRPMTACAIVKNIRLNSYSLFQLIQLQEKIAASFGRNRKEVAIGIYDLDKIKFPVKYTTVKPTGIKFVPLDFEEAMTPKEILNKHPKGKEFGHLLKKSKEYPIFIDSDNEVLSMPPIINSKHSGYVTEKTKNVFIECTGFNLKLMLPALNSMAAALAERGGKIESLDVKYPSKKIVTPDFTPKKSEVTVELINRLSGLALTIKEIVKLLEQARYSVKVRGRKLEVLYPSYRQDIMHPVDIVEDVIISYGYNRIEPESLKLPTIGESNKLETFSNKIADLVVGLGFQEILSYSLTSKDNLFKKMNVKEDKIVEIENPVSLNWNVFRNWLLPGLLEFLAANQHVEYPQKIFEIGNVTMIDEKQETKTKDVRKLCCAISNTKVGYEDISSKLDSFMRNLGIKYKLNPASHPSFIEGRMAKILVDKKAVGIIGEINPHVLNNWNMEMHVVVFEIIIDDL